MSEAGAPRKPRFLSVGLAALVACTALATLGWRQFGTPGSPTVPSGSAAIAHAEAEADSFELQPDLEHGDLATLIAAGDAQIERNSLTRPEGANAVQTWLAALAREPHDPRVRAGLEATLDRLGAQIVDYLGAGRLKNAHDLHFRARDFATRAGLTTEEVWRHYKKTVRDGLIAGIEAAATGLDRRRAERLAELAQEIDPDHPDLVPALTTVAVVPRRGDMLRAESGPPLVLLRAAQADVPALAVMTREVSRGEYAAFARDSGREPARCHSRLSLLQLFAPRSWQQPGFDQDDSHPAVCVSPADAQAYAAWLSARTTGGGFRLPTREEWREFGAVRTGDACALGHISCGAAMGTIAAGAGTPGPHGLHGLFGNAAEWLGECLEDCSLQLAGGGSWRDRPEDLTSDRLGTRPADRGYDDVGFRLVRELGASPTSPTLP